MDRIYCEDCERTFDNFVEGELPHGTPIGYCPECGEKCYLTFESMYGS